MTQHKFFRKVRRERFKKYKIVKESENNFNFKESKVFLELLKYEKRKRSRFNKLKLNCNKKRKSINFENQQCIQRKPLDLPKNIGFDLNLKDTEELIKKTNKLQVLIGQRVNHKKLKNISTDGLLLLVSIIDKTLKLFRQKRNFREMDFGYNPKYGIKKDNEKLKYLLLESGYWNYFGIKKPYSIDSKEENYFLSIKSSNKLEMKEIVSVRKFINEKVDFIVNEEIREYFDDAISEAMANTIEHAYIKDTPNRTKGKWWLCGYYGKQKNYLEFSFRDYGVGLRSTLNYRKGERVKNFLRDLKAEKRDSELIKLAVNDQLPKYKQKKNNKEARRGYGFKRFKKFAKENGLDSEMLIVSGKGKYNYSIENALENERIEELSENVDGFLIRWKIYLNKKD